MSFPGSPLADDPARTQAPHMAVHPHVAAVDSLVDAFNRQRIWFGTGPFSGLVAPCSVHLSSETAVEVGRSLQAVWEWFHSWQALYRDLVAVEPGQALARLCEWGLSAEQIRVQRRSALAGSLPSLVRLDTVTAVPSVQIAEAQWKGGGEGFLAGIDSTYRSFFPLVPGEGPLAGLVDMWAAYYADIAGGGYAVSVVRSDWIDADRAFAAVLADQGVNVIVVTPAELDARLSLRNGRAVYALDDRVVEIAALRCDRLVDTITDRRIDGVLACADAGTLVLDPPPSYLCSAKFGMALPFTDEYRSYFSDDVRRYLIPTVLVSDPPSCAPLAEALAAHGGAALMTLAHWDDLPRLPRALRRRLVVKCGSANPVWNQGGRGVWKLGGPTSADERVWATVLARVRTGREAWILEPYVDQTWPVDLYHPDRPDEPHACDAHTRLLFYGRRDVDTVRFVGGGTNFSSFWKVSGKSAKWAAGQRLEGSAFCDLRISDASPVGVS